MIECELGWEGVKRATLDRVASCPGRCQPCEELVEEHPWQKKKQMQRPQEGARSEVGVTDVSMTVA